MQDQSATRKVAPPEQDLLSLNPRDQVTRVDSDLVRPATIGAVVRSSSVEDIEIHILLEEIYQHYGLDFRDYSMPSLRRRLQRAIHEERLNSIPELQHRLLQDRSAWDRLLRMLSVHVTMFFRDPDLFLTFRHKVIPELRKLPYFRIWHIGCSSGEEAYSMAILLHEEGLLERARLYATDLNESELSRAKKGIYSLDLLESYEANYKAGGGRHRLSDYYTAKYESGLMKPVVRDRIVFAQHNLTCDNAFTEFHVVFCRNVLIYFNKSLQERVHKLVDNSLSAEGFFALGQKENLKHTLLESNYHLLESAGDPVSLYQKIARGEEN